MSGLWAFACDVPSTWNTLVPDITWLTRSLSTGLHSIVNFSEVCFLLTTSQSLYHPQLCHHRLLSLYNVSFFSRALAIFQCTMYYVIDLFMLFCFSSSLKCQSHEGRDSHLVLCSSPEPRTVSGTEYVLNKYLLNKF